MNRWGKQDSENGGQQTWPLSVKFPEETSIFFPDGRVSGQGDTTTTILTTNIKNGQERESMVAKKERNKTKKEDKKRCPIRCPKDILFVFCFLFFLDRKGARKWTLITQSW